MYANFKKFSNKWLKDNSISHDSIDGWLLGDMIEPHVKTICTKEISIKKPPYHNFFRYKIVNDQPNMNSEVSNKRINNLKANDITKKKVNSSDQTGTIQGSKSSDIVEDRLFN